MASYEVIDMGSGVRVGRRASLELQAACRKDGAADAYRGSGGSWQLSDDAERERKKGREVLRVTIARGA